MTLTLAQQAAEPEMVARSDGDPSLPPRRVSERFGRWFGGTARKGGIALADQAIVSGINFLTQVLVGRCCGPAELGIYSLGFTIVVFVASCHQALVVVPYTLHVHRLPNEKRAGFAGDVLLHCAILGLAATVVLALATCAPALGLGPASMVRLGAILAVTVPFYLLREFGRRFAFAHLEMKAAIRFDLAAGVSQAVLLCGLAVSGRLTAPSAFAAAGCCYAAVGALWLYDSRKRFKVRLDHSLASWLHNWSFSKWVLAEQITTALNGSLMYWLLAAMLGVASTGLFAACTQVLNTFNPIMLALHNVILPRIAVAQTRSDRDEMPRVVVKTTVVIGALTGAFAGVLLIFGPQIMRGIYGNAYDGQERVISVLAIEMFIRSLATAPGYGLWAKQGARTLFIIGLARLAVAAPITLAFAGRLGPVAAAYGILAGSVVCLVWICVAYRRKVGMQDAVPAAEEATA